MEEKKLIKDRLLFETEIGITPLTSYVIKVNLLDDVRDVAAAFSVKYKIGNAKHVTLLQHLESHQERYLIESELPASLRHKVGAYAKNEPSLLVSQVKAAKGVIYMEG